MENIKTKSGLNVSDFAQQSEGKETQLCVLANNRGAEMTVLNYGARIVSIVVPDRNGKDTDVVTGYSSINDYLQAEELYFGAICGRYANRIAKGQFSIDGTLYNKLAINNGPNSLHGGIKGFSAAVWDMLQTGPQSVELSYTSADGEEGYPGVLKTKVCYCLTDDNEVVITYMAETDKPTVLNLTNHSYFNLSGQGDESVCDHLLQINADAYLPTDSAAIPLGPKDCVEGTPMDFRAPHEIGELIEEPFEQLIFAKGYDHTYVLNKETDGELSFCARCVSPKTGIVLEIQTTEPGVQLYTGNWLNGGYAGKNGNLYPSRSAFCLETQHFPDSPNQPDYPSSLLRPGMTFKSKTIFRFSTENK